MFKNRAVQCPYWELWAVGLVGKSLSLNVRNRVTRQRKWHEKQAPSRGEEISKLLQHCNNCDALAHILWGPQKSLEDTGYHETLWVPPWKGKRNGTVNGSTYLLMGHTHPHPSFSIPPCIKDCVDHRVILISNWDVEKIFSGLDFKTWPEGSRRDLQKSSK